MEMSRSRRNSPPPEVGNSRWQAVATKQRLELKRMHQEIAALRDTIADLTHQREQHRKWATRMVEMMAEGGKLDAYREMGERIAELEAENEDLKSKLNKET